MALNSLTVDNCPESLRPAQNLCTSCRHAIWYQLPKSLHCRCTLRSRESYTSATPRKVVTDCDGPTMATNFSDLIAQRDATTDLDLENSTTFDALPQNHQPPGATTCSNCPSAVWYALPAETHCDCLMLHAEAYTSAHPSAHIVACDGVLISALQLLKKQQA